MKKLAVLGPEGTYSSKAVLKLKKKYEIEYYPTLLACSMALNKNQDALLPYENTLDGFVMEALDSLLKNDFYIVEEVKLPVGFHFIGNTSQMNDIKEVYVQYKAYGQCLDFISKHHLTPIITQSNMESLQLFQQHSGDQCGAIVPSHVEIKNYPVGIQNVADSIQNETRFVRISLTPNSDYHQERLRASIMILPLEDQPGLLYSILEVFKEYHINLKSILSRPRRDRIGNYVFYMELEMQNDQLWKLDKIAEVLNHHDFLMKIVGIYNELEETK